MIIDEFYNSNNNMLSALQLNGSIIVNDVDELHLLLYGMYI